MTRYVLADIEQVGAELTRRADEVSAWLDSAGSGSAPIWPSASSAAPEWFGSPGMSEELASTIAEVDLACYQALSAALARLAGAAESLSDCASDARAVDAGVARQLCRWGAQ